MKKGIFLSTLLIFLSLILLSCPGNHTTSVPSSPITIATWNIRIISNDSRDDTELSQIAEILKRYDLIAIKKTRDTVVLDRLRKKLTGYDHIASSPVETLVTEIYAFFYNTDLILPIGSPYLYIETMMSS